MSVSSLIDLRLDEFYSALAAVSLRFTDKAKQERYNAVSFEELRREISVLKVGTPDVDVRPKEKIN